MLQQGQRPNCQVQKITGEHRRNIVAAQCDGRGFQAQAQVIVAVNHGVFGVVSQHPKQVSQQQQPSQGRHAGCHGAQAWHITALHRRKGHGHTKAEGHTQHGLRHGNQTFGIGVGQCDGQGQH